MNKTDIEVGKYYQTVGSKKTRIGRLEVPARALFLCVEWGVCRPVFRNWTHGRFEFKHHHGVTNAPKDIELPLIADEGAIEDSFYQLKGNMEATGKCYDTNEYFTISRGTTFKCIKRSGKIDRSHKFEALFQTQRGRKFYLSTYTGVYSLGYGHTELKREVLEGRVEAYRELFHQEANKLKKLNQAKELYFDSEEEYNEWAIQEIAKHNGDPEITGKILRGEWAATHLKRKV